MSRFMLDALRSQADDETECHVVSLILIFYKFSLR